jgi:hypothetical protein
MQVWGNNPKMFLQNRQLSFEIAFGRSAKTMDQEQRDFLGR